MPSPTGSGISGLTAVINTGTIQNGHRAIPLIEVVSLETTSLLISDGRLKLTPDERCDEPICLCLAEKIACILLLENNNSDLVLSQLENNSYVLIYWKNSNDVLIQWENSYEMIL